MTDKEAMTIKDLEERYDRFLPLLESLKESVQEINEHYDDYKALSSYYGSEEWFKLRDEKPAIRSGILNEDQIYDLLIDHHYLILELLKLTTKMYQTS
ncbi:DUF4298 domain-containing protein [Streptococcus didelphis]|nr:DUF4298 domain-containing protein [Streptococcus didelphis]WMB29080.1 DUF4298 domain-containing protein [Streptococcus didelphis]